MLHTRPLTPARFTPERSSATLTAETLTAETLTAEALTAETTAPTVVTEDVFGDNVLVLERLAATGAPLTRIEDEQGNPLRGAVFGIGLSLPLWGLIGLLVRELLS